MMAVISDLDSTTNGEHKRKLEDIEERLGMVEYSVYKDKKANTRFDDIYIRLDATDLELKQHCSDCVDTIAALDRRTSQKVFEQD
jgi:hypothetical protein